MLSLVKTKNSASLVYHQFTKMTWSITGFNPHEITSIVARSPSFFGKLTITCKTLGIIYIYIILYIHTIIYIHMVSVLYGTMIYYVVLYGILYFGLVT